MSEGMNEREAKLEAYLDGTLGGEERAVFEREIAGDDAVRDQVEAQRQMDLAIRRMFVPAVGGSEVAGAVEAAQGAEPGVAGVIGPTGSTGGRTGNRSRQARQALLAAALLLVA